MRWLTGCCAVLAMVLGWYVHASEGIPMQALSDGTLIYSLSAGSEDAQLLGAGLMAFGLTAVAAVLVGLRDQWGAVLWVAYALNLALLAAMVGLVTLDHSLLGAAILGEIAPLGGVLVAGLPLLVLLGKALGAVCQLGRMRP